MAALAAMLLTYGQVLAQTGGLTGRVTAKEGGALLAQTYVALEGTGRSTWTDEAGRYRFDGLIPGEYSLLFVRPGFERRSVTRVAVIGGQVVETDVALGFALIEPEKVVVSAPDLSAGTDTSILDIRREAVGIQDGVSREQIRNAGASDAVGAIKMVVGASVVDGKYATVRGLSDRYTGTTLNGVRVPSSDPRRRAAQIDVFPTATIESITVTKTFTPDLQGDFSGGGVDIRTRSIPDGLTVSVTNSLGNDSLASDNPAFLTYPGGGTGQEARGLPAILDRRRGATLQLPQPGTADGRNLAVNRIVDRQSNALTPVLGTSRRAPGKNNGYSVTVGNRMDFGREGKIGVIAAHTEKNTAEFYDGAANHQILFNPANIDYEFREDARGVLALTRGTMGTLVIQPTARHEIAVRHIHNASIRDESRFQRVFFPAAPNEGEQNQSLRFSERSVRSTQLAGWHSVPLGSGDGLFRAVEVEYTLAHNATTQDEPDQRLFRNETSSVANGRILISSRPDNIVFSDANRRIFRSVEEQGDVAALDVSIPFSAWSGREGKIKLGGYAEQVDRDFRQDSFAYESATQYGPASNSAVRQNNSARTTFFDPSNPLALWTDVFLDPARIGLAGNRCGTGDPAGIDPWSNPTCAAVDQILWYLTPIGANLDVDYRGEQAIDARYLMAELPIGGRLSLIVGAREERTRMETDPDSRSQVQIIETQPDGSRIFRNVSDSDPRASGLIRDRGLLPAIAANYELMAGRMKLRASWNRTLARPTFRELAAVTTIEFLDGDEFTGNPELGVTDIENADLRWEWFPGRSRVLAFSLFTKRLSDPIERISFTVAGRDLVQPVNYPSGSVDGWELEARSDLAPIAGWLAPFSAGINYTELDSAVDVPIDEQDSLGQFELSQQSRRLQGQPAYLFNAHCTYDNRRSGTTVSLFYNVIGETLLTGAARGQDGARPNTFTRSFERVDFSFRQRVREHISFSVRVKNLMRRRQDSVFRTPDGAEFLRTSRSTPREVVLGMGLNW